MKLSLGQKIRELRLRKGLTQSELSDGLVTPSMISQIESDKANPSHQLLLQIAEKLETPVEYFITDVETQLEKLNDYRIAQTLMYKGDFKEAIATFEKMQDAPSAQISMGQVMFDLAYCYMHIGRTQRAEEIFEKTLDTAISEKDNLQKIRVMNQLGKLAAQQENYPIAIHYWKKGYDLAKKEMPTDPFLLSEIARQLGTVHSKLAEWDQAKEYFAEASKLLQERHNIPQIANVYSDLATAYRVRGSFEQSTQFAQFAASLYQAAQLLETIIDTETRYGVALGETGDTDQAVAKLERSMSLNENYEFPHQSGEIHTALANVLFQNGEFDKAILHCQRALQLNDKEDLENAKIYCILATIDLEREKYDSALEWIRKSADIIEREGTAADKVKVYAVYGDIYKKQGMFRDAMECLEKMNRAMLENLRDRKVMI